jgi:hypothetical protein
VSSGVLIIMLTVLRQKKCCHPIVLNLYFAKYFKTCHVVCSFSGPNLICSIASAYHLFYNFVVGRELMTDSIVVLCLFSSNQFKPMADPFKASYACWIVLLAAGVHLRIAITMRYALNGRVLHYLDAQ